ncbi:TonB-dependent receptor plug domain-containing protein [Asaia bogorensis]|uniref:TonB-dependent receptor n=1 Tax=Asaia bogorensis NBRC 16594 TaxID=1231624 RepID=A0AAN4U2N3_9PROT|nr:TonB-dependent receptor [Asaia bogorensis]BAT20596.1 TonB-dependent receptor [Asaia bogorensis NBRC 16594]GBQ76554.1 TonB-dependent receptor-like protein [Asaia bogorensis NBRC 16594]GEL53607.1 TonB-dependent receptor [Asaia bogorensis NBRC 16594]
MTSRHHIRNALLAFTILSVPHELSGGLVDTAQAQITPLAPQGAPPGTVSGTRAKAGSAKSPAIAQKRADKASNRPSGNREVLTVTGSHIANSRIKSPTPVSTLSAQEIRNQSPTNNLADLVNQLPQFAGSTTPQNSTLALSSGLAGINALNLRNLGAVRSLVLIDGRRTAPSAITGIVDINTLPQQLVKRVDVVTGGASAQYGSDAVAGVTNFVLDKTYTGLKVDADSGISNYGDGQNEHAAIAGGFGFAKGKGHVLLSGDYAHQDGIFKITRGWNQNGERIIANPAYVAGNGQPYYIRVGNAGTNNALPGGIINASTGAVANSLRGVYFGQGGSVNHYNYGSPSTSSVSVGGDEGLANNNVNLGLQPESDRKNLYGRLSYDVASWMTLYAEGAYNQSNYIYNAGPQYLTSIAIKSTNPYLIDALGADALRNVTGVTVGTTALDMPYRQITNTRDVQRYTFGGEGNFTLFGHKASWTAYAQYGVTHSHEQINNVMNTARIANATDAVRNASGQIVCRSSLTDPGNGCAPIDWLGTGVMSQAAISYVLGNPWREQRFQEIVSGVNLSTIPFATWAGDVNVAIGGEYRDERASGYVPTEYQKGWSVGNYLPTFGNYNVKEAYVETAVPLARGLAANGAVRATDYSTSGYVTTWKIGGTWQPIRDILFRATQSHDIRAPNINELYNAGTSQTTTVLDPATGKTDTVLSTTTGNPNLKPETANTTVVGAVITPRYVPGLALSIDWFHTKIKHAIQQFYPQSIIDECYQGYTTFCSAIRPDPSGTRDLLISASPFNFAKLETSGIDIDASYTFPLRRILPKAGGAFTLHGQASNYLKYVSDSGVGYVVDTAGDITNGPPKWIYRFSATYSAESYSITAVARGISAGNYSNSYVQCTTTCGVYNANYPSINNNRVAGTFYFDMNFTYKLPVQNIGQMQIFLNVTNLGNAPPILLPTSGLAADSTYSSLLGRTYRGGIRMEF